MANWPEASHVAQALNSVERAATQILRAFGYKPHASRSRIDFFEADGHSVVMKKHKPRIMIDLTDEIDNALGDWTCPCCKKTYSAPHTEYWDRILELFVCSACSTRKKN
jgi:hypothetical protein